MPRKKRNIIVVVEPLSGDGRKEFQKRVNEVYCDITREKLRQSTLGIDEKKSILDTLCHTFEVEH